MLELLSKSHNKWVSMVIKMGCDKMTADDIVQDMYLRIYKLVKDPEKIMYNATEVNHLFVYTVLRNMYYSHTKSVKKYPMYSWIDGVDDRIKDDSINVADESKKQDSFSFAERDLMSSIDAEVDSWHYYDKILFNFYFNEGKSLRAISKGSMIGLNSIHNSIKNHQLILRERLGDKYINYINKRNEER